MNHLISMTILHNMRNYDFNRDRDHRDSDYRDRERTERDHRDRERLRKSDAPVVRLQNLMNGC